MAKQTFAELAALIEAALPENEHERRVTLENGAVLQVVRLKLPDR